MLKKAKSVLTAAQDPLDQLGITFVKPSKPAVISTGFPKVNDDILRIGGVPNRRIVQFWGKQDSGKTSFAIHVAACAQEQYPDHGPVVWFDTENAFDPDYARALGLDVDDPSKFRLVIGTSAEQVMRDLLAVLSSNAALLVVVDSLGNMAANSELDGLEIDKKTGNAKAQQPGVFSKLTTRFVKNIVSIQNDPRHQTFFIVINQMRDKIGVMFGDPSDHPGGHAWKHNLAMNIRFNKVEDVVINGQTVGFELSMNVRRNKLGILAKTDKASHPTLLHVGGKDAVRRNAVIEKAQDAGILIVNNQWYSLVDLEGNPLHKWNGASKMHNELELDPDLLDTMEDLATTAVARNAK